jgi:hypothetical protein
MEYDSKLLSLVRPSKLKPDVTDRTAGKDSSIADSENAAEGDPKTGPLLSPPMLTLDPCSECTESDSDRGS